MSAFPPWGSYEAQETDAHVLSALSNDPDGWVVWIDNPPPPDVEVECMRDDEPEPYRVIAREQSLYWNVAGVRWRSLRAN